MVRGLDKGQKAALIISECQRGVIEEGLSPFPSLAEQVKSRGIVSRIGSLAESFRAAGLPVLHAHVVHRPDYADLPVTSVIVGLSVRNGRMKAGTIDVDSVAELPVQPGDILHARSFSLVGFHGTDLDQTLRNMGVRTLVIAGVSSNVAVNGMALCASDLGYQVVIPEDCTAGATAESHAFMMKEALPLYATVTSGNAVIELLAGRSKD
ncbi:cysteine hydrolase family protein [Noviherbaspirillum saxi]|uniref:Cysteine hydrolase n=1 Tax=Noviherbaspirillum saxi TaxID=2320863 RepID=A0A3A3FEB6_9BURK|nr:cysteine hydrolase [Noviherbaspirillum saxi]RJF91701.1 cysteine hydrolase [Noviherbaspirillum saxi]